MELFQGIDRRVTADDSDFGYFLALTNKLEFLTKVTTVGILACVADETEYRHRYSIEHRLVRADSLGDWVQALNDVLVGPPSQYFRPAAREIVQELTQRVTRDDWRHEAVAHIHQAAREVDAVVDLGAKVALRQFFEIGVALRNRTRGHGAPTTHQCAESCVHLNRGLKTFVDNCRLFHTPWAYLHKNLSGKYNVSSIAGDQHVFAHYRTTNNERIPSGTYIYLDAPLRLNLLFTNVELGDIWLPNGNYKNGHFESLSYITNDITKRDGSDWSIPPGQLPPSETEGDPVLEPLGGAFANVPPLLGDYVQRADLVNGVISELQTIDRHPIVSLTGPGGIGKTTIAIAAIRELVERDDLPYHTILWISARDIDLLSSGAKAVQPKVINQDEISKAAVHLLDPSERSQKGFSAKRYMEKCLAEGAAGKTLFVFDNFETLRSPADVFAWIDLHVRSPNKVLITTRIRDFRGDYHIDIGGMNEAEAGELIRTHATRLGIGHLVAGRYAGQLVSESDGHPYVIKILLGQVAVEQRALKPERIMASTDHILRALFERTYSALSPGGQRVFLLLSRWRVLVPEVAVGGCLAETRSGSVQRGRRFGPARSVLAGGADGRRRGGSAAHRCPAGRRDIRKKKARG